jgi:N-acetylmuramoyl-L-alanine amidase
MGRFIRICLLGLILPVLTSCMTKTRPLLAIDVGHSKLHPGVISARGQTEFEFNAQLAKVINNTMRSHGISSLQIGDDGNMLVLLNRTSAAQQAGATFLLSIHHDSVQPHYLKTWQWRGITQHYADDFSGFSLFVSRKTPKFTNSLRCASAIGSALKRQGFHATTHHAEAISGENKAWADQNNGVYYYDNLVVLKTAIMPAVLLEAGVIVNRDEEQSMQTAKIRTVMAEAIRFGLVQCGLIP